MAHDFKAAQGTQTRTVVANLRALEGEFALSGYASVFNTWSHNLGGFREQIKSGAFARSIRTKADVHCLFNHAADNVLGRTKSGTLTLVEDSHGLKFRCQLNQKSQAHKDLYEAVKRGDLDECSFAFTVPKSAQSWTDGTDPETGENCAFRTISDVDLIDVSVVTYPAYPGTEAGARNHHNAPHYGAAPQRFAPSSAGGANRMRELALIYVREYKLAFEKIWAAIHPSGRDATAMDEVMSFASRMQYAHECSELACAYYQDAQDALDDSDDDEADDDTRAHFRAAKEHVEQACQRMAAARLAHGQHMARKAKWSGKAHVA